jgi:DNA topoisomerase-1
MDAAGLLDARAARLRYVSDAAPGIRRVRRGRGFAYLGADGEPVSDAATLRRIRDIVIPPAWTDVWICPLANGHIQATGRDARGRKQYRYHERWREVRDEAKYGHLIEFAAALSRIRERVDADMALPGLPREKVVATIVHLLDLTALRIGNDEYARENDSFGLTTLRTGHVEVSGSTVRFQFRGKSGKEVSVGIDDRRVARVVRRCEELPGQELFQYLDDGGQRHLVHSDDVNAWLCETTGQRFTAKDFRTWAGTVRAATELRGSGEWTTQREAHRLAAAAVKEVARALGNTPAVCRRCYIHPEVLVAHLEGGLARALDAPIGSRRADAGLHADEAAVLAMLRSRLAAATAVAS